MSRVKRLAHGELRFDAKNRTPQGYLLCDALIARAGNIQEYQRSDGSTRREYRPPEEVFKADALATAAQVPITFTPDTWNWHPPERVTPENVRKYSVGMTGAEAKADGEWVKTTAVVMDADAIKAAESGEFAQLSCGYDADFDPTPGQTKAGERYDGVQRNIRVNHIAMVRAARAGPEARLRLDANDNAILDHDSNGGQDMEKIVINGVSYEVSPQVAQAIQAERKAHADSQTANQKLHADALAAAEKAAKDAKAELDKAKAAADGEKARADAATKKADDAEKARADAADPKKLQAAISARVDLEGKARAILGDEEKLSERTDAEVKKLVAAKAFEGIKLDGKSDAYIEALFDKAIADHAEQHPMSEARRVVDPTKREDGDAGGEDEPLTAEDAYSGMVKNNRTAALPKAAGAKK